MDVSKAGAYHNSDLPFWFGNIDTLNLYRPTRVWSAADYKLSDQMQDVLVAFARLYLRRKLFIDDVVRHRIDHNLDVRIFSLKTVEEIAQYRALVAVVVPCNVNLDGILRDDTGNERRQHKHH